MRIRPAARLIQSAAHHALVLLFPAGPAFPSSENTKTDKLFDVLSQSGRRVTSCMVDREFAIGKHATGAAWQVSGMSRY
jgi:hypothetical protein